MADLRNSHDPPMVLLSGLTENRSAVQYMETALRYLTSAATTLSRSDLLAAFLAALFRHATLAELEAAYREIRAASANADS